ncbi:hypothetical protein ACG83_10960 [Frankia sp. R43]|uniref:hypothetical protein n=1 Tax=Frankia sp. R43 TaxID=269536 RepID=UPI0006C9EFC9|nr:hypothetical protein [Frankia sp. R43]KPM55785.1 hypothetical protein ACG83_10960 [Frankia sp. R43]
MSGPTRGGFAELLDAAGQPTDSEGPDAQYNADVWELRSRIGLLSDALRTRLVVSETDLEPTATDLVNVREALTADLGPVTSRQDASQRGFSANRAYLSLLREAHTAGDQEQAGQMVRLMTAVERVVDDLSPMPQTPVLEGGDA